MENGTEYDALSYAWGSTLDKKTIQLNGTLFLVTQNLHSALRHLQGGEEARKIWIDAICIDQDNTNERSHQVQVMGRIYKNTRQVII
jgi:hypothetical protein